jgi:hypothetical protein
VKRGNNESAQLCRKIYGTMVVCRREKGASVVSESEVLVMLVTADGNDPARNIPERHKIV